MNIIQTSIEGVVIVEPRLFRDARGYFFESFSARDFSEKVRAVDFVQDNESRSTCGVPPGESDLRASCRRGAYGG